MLRIGKPAEAVLTTLRAFPTLEPLRLQPVNTQILGLPSRRDLLWQAVVFERDAHRVGSKVIIGRQMMGYSRRKLHAQKGTGRARMGDRGNPIRHDGGRAFGREAPGDKSTGIKHGVYSEAVRTALSLKFREGHLYVIDGKTDFTVPHELMAREFLKTHGWGKASVTFVVDEHRQNLFDSFENCEKVDIVPKELLEVQDILKPRRLIIEKSALDYLVNLYKPSDEVVTRPPPSAEFYPRPVGSAEPETSS